MLGKSLTDTELSQSQITAGIKKGTGMERKLAKIEESCSVTWHKGRCSFCFMLKLPINIDGSCTEDISICL